MNAYRKHVTLFAVALAATVLSVGSVFGQELSTVDAQGKFTLPFEAHWGKATLPAGQYTFQSGRYAGGTQMIKVSGEGKGNAQAFVLVTDHVSSPSANTSELVCIRHGNTRTVRALVLTSIGETMYFSIPQNVRIFAQTRDSMGRTLVAQAPELIQRIRIEATER